MENHDTQDTLILDVDDFIHSGSISEMSMERQQFDENLSSEDAEQSFREAMKKAKDQIGLSKADFIQQHSGDKNIRDDYEFQNTLGEGSFGTVFRVLHKSSNDQRAVKKINGIKDKDLKKLKEEYTNLMILDHPNIVKIFERYEEGNFQYIVTELCKGGTIYDYLSRFKSTNEYMVCKIFKQVAEAVSYCHSSGVAHRDLKPDNILISSDKELIVKVIDFGLSKQMDHTDENQYYKSQYGTLYFMAPEVSRGKYTNACDLWSLGVILYFTMCGEYPFNGQSQMELLHNIEEMEYGFEQQEWMHVSSELKHLISQLLVEEEDRLTAEQVLQSPWIKRYSEEQMPNDTIQIQVGKLTEFLKRKEIFKCFKLYLVSKVRESTVYSEAQGFMSLDENSNGYIEKEELLKFYTQEELISGELDAIINNVDSDNNGKINYSEWIAATAEMSIFSELKLREAFDHFDKNGDGYISLGEMKKYVQKSHVEKEWETIGTNSDHIDFATFKQILHLG